MLSAAGALLMKLFIVVLVLNRIAGVFGPLPYGSTECRTRTHFMEMQCQTPGSGCPENAHFVCEWSERTPVPGTPEREASVLSKWLRYVRS